MLQSQHQSNLFDDPRELSRAWQDRYRERGLTALLVLDLCFVFFALPLAVKGPPTAAPITRGMVLALVLVVVMLSRRRGAIAAVLLGMAAIVTGALPLLEWPSIAVSMLRRGGDIVIFATLSWVVSHAVMRPAALPFAAFKVRACCI